MKYFFKVIGIFFLIIIVWILYNVSILPLGRLSEGITQKSIASIKLDMDKFEVVEKLGVPFNSMDSYTISLQEKIKPGSFRNIYNYSKPGFLWDVEVYIHFNKNNKVIRVYMEEGDSCFFLYDREHSNKYIRSNIYNKFIPEA